MRIDVLRAETYELLAHAFRRPTPQEIDTITTKAADVLNGAVAFLPRHLTAASRPFLQSFLAEVRAKGPEATARDLTLEYSRLFVGPHSLPCAPYSSVYLDGGQVMGRSTVDARSRYLKEGLRPAAGWAEPPDHIAVELEFMAWLAAAHRAPTTEGRQHESSRLLTAQSEFLRDHLGRWGPTFADRLKEASTSHLYLFLAEFLPVWLIFDRDLLDAMAAALSKVPASCE